MQEACKCPSLLPSSFELNYGQIGRSGVCKYIRLNRLYVLYIWLISEFVLLEGKDKDRLVGVSTNILIYVLLFDI